MKYLTTSQVAELLSTDEGKVRKWISAGELVAANIAVRPNGKPRWRISESELEDFLERRRNPIPAAKLKRPILKVKKFV